MQKCRCSITFFSECRQRYRYTRSTTCFLSGILSKVKVSFCVFYMFFYIFLLVVVSWLSLPVQLIACKDSSPKCVECDQARSQDLYLGALRPSFSVLLLPFHSSPLLSFPLIQQGVWGSAVSSPSSSGQSSTDKLFLVNLGEFSAKNEASDNDTDITVY